jgi:23S rRNA (uridine2552-2'-O)-methyltransferase
MRTKRGSSRRWLREHGQDEFVEKSRLEGYRSRAAFKLMELDRRDGVFARGMLVVDLGAAPGSWSQYAAERVGAEGRVVALDMLPMEPLAGVDFLQGDFREEEVLRRLEGSLAGAEASVVMSDMAPNLSGMSAVDQPRAMLLAELALGLASRVLTPGGTFVSKAFQGEGFDAFVRDVRAVFQTVRVRKPKASRARSREVYVLARGYSV